MKYLKKRKEKEMLQKQRNWYKACVGGEEKSLRKILTFKMEFIGNKCKGDTNLLQYKIKSLIRSVVFSLQCHGTISGRLHKIAINFLKTFPIFKFWKAIPGRHKIIKLYGLKSSNYATAAVNLSSENVRGQS